MNVAEFLLFMGQCQCLCVKLLPCRGKLGTVMLRIAYKLLMQRNRFHFLLMPPPGCAVANDVDTSVTVQELVDQWQEQDCRHAMLMAPAAIVLQAARFCYDTEF